MLREEQRWAQGLLELLQRNCGTGRSSGKGRPDQPRRPLPELTPGPTSNL